jgi:hypothetical protein
VYDSLFAEEGRELFEKGALSAREEVERERAEKERMRVLLRELQMRA